LRSAGNQRRYPRGVLRQVAVIKTAQRLGIPLAQIRAALAALPEGRVPTTQDWAALSEVWRADLDARIRQLTALRDHLT
ncbi:MerR family DNA-binding protein, partial [Mycobacterium tuberculosis]|nr:MerR family DNA-binding protein [Mycobacterium tuberculosis]